MSIIDISTKFSYSAVEKQIIFCLLEGGQLIKKNKATICFVSASMSPVFLWIFMVWKVKQGGKSYQSTDTVSPTYV